MNNAVQSHSTASMKPIHVERQAVALTLWLSFIMDTLSEIGTIRLIQVEELSELQIYLTIFVLFFLHIKPKG